MCIRPALKINQINHGLMKHIYQWVISKGAVRGHSWIGQKTFRILGYMFLTGHDWQKPTMTPTQVEHIHITAKVKHNKLRGVGEEDSWLVGEQWEQEGKGWIREEPDTLVNMQGQFCMPLTHSIISLPIINRFLTFVFKFKVHKWLELKIISLNPKPKS